MQAIRTRYHGATNTRGARITATCEGGSIQMSYDYSLDAEPNHRKAVELLLKRLGWVAVYQGGQFGGDYYWIGQSAWTPETRSIDVSEAA
jgi:hypothetical protein